MLGLVVEDQWPLTRLGMGKEKENGHLRQVLDTETFLLRSWTVCGCWSVFFEEGLVMIDLY